VKFIRDVVIAPFSLLSVVVVTFSVIIDFVAVGGGDVFESSAVEGFPPRPRQF